MLLLYCGQGCNGWLFQNLLFRHLLVHVIPSIWRLFFGFHFGFPPNLASFGGFPLLYREECRSPECCYYLLYRERHNELTTIHAKLTEILEAPTFLLGFIMRRRQHSHHLLQERMEMESLQHSDDDDDDDVLLEDDGLDARKRARSGMFGMKSFFSIQRRMGTTSAWDARERM